MEYPPLPFTVFPSKTKLVWFLLMTAAFTAIGVGMVISGEGFGWFVAAFFGLGAVLFLFQLFRPKSSFLTVDETGIEFGSLFQKSRLAWSEIGEFGTFTPNPYLRFASKFVGFNFSPGYKGPTKYKGLAKTMSGFESQLPNTYGFRADDLAQLLTHYRQKALLGKTDYPA